MPDIAIIQLAEPVADDGRVEIACLPRPNDALPQLLTAFGWGRRGYGDSPTDFYPDHLRYVEGSTRGLPQWSPGLDQLPVCLTATFCFFAVRGRMNGTTFYGDSGAGVVSPSLTEQSEGAPTTLHGIASSGQVRSYSLNEAAGEPKQLRIFGLATNVSNYLAGERIACLSVGVVWPLSGLVWPQSGLVWPQSCLVWPLSGLVWPLSGLVLPLSCLV